MLDSQERARLVIPYEPRAPVGGYLSLAAVSVLVAAGTALANSLREFSEAVERGLVVTAVVAGSLVFIALTVAFVVTYRFQEQMEPATEVTRAATEPIPDVRVSGPTAQPTV